VIEIKQQIVGFILFFSKVGEGHILNVGVHPDYQRRGYGQLLMEKILAVAAEEMLNKIYLEVRYSNEGAIALYKKMGFVPIGVRKNYYKNHDHYEDAFVFEKIIHFKSA
ncbi:MAG: ribosomal protein S18-alanine N-acetyltransferase, partial [Gammaproteobacteria bacterium]|nr:ribosomal protein S18-alanine N-acetyltransferase [Gammaproteobacteria bacterium]